MLSLVLILLSLHSIGQIACQGEIVYPLDANEGSPCVLRSGNTGQCRKASACSTAGTGGLVLCRSNGRQLVVCCDVVQQQCNAAKTKNNVSDHVVGVVHKPSVGEFPFMALVMFNNSEQFCGASIISDRFLLTAAHCFAESNATSVRLGTIEADDSLADTIPIANIYRHPRYARSRRLNDIALIELRTSITLNSNVQPVCLYTEKKELPEMQDLIVTGWGKDNSDDVSTVLLKGIVRPVLRTECQQRFDGISKIRRLNITDGHLCALGDLNEEGKATDACQGDSGGPLVMHRDDQYYLVGVVSSGVGCGGANLAGLYTWVAKYVDWVIEQGVWRNVP
ncbi:CLIP domain-containing serine protease C9-like isoform X3 [Ochlerotatus camptorhynchus]|uniref:CLIP domain-containing serine protease C9-like isoform X3 n=1 Tax=Ochlerotatus camptorhynchus TaxID=644619 RepID=UPI0031E07A15